MKKLIITGNGEGLVTVTPVAPATTIKVRRLMKNNTTGHTLWGELPEEGKEEKDLRFFATNKDVIYQAITRSIVGHDIEAVILAAILDGHTVEEITIAEE